MADNNVFETLNAINVNGHTESKNGLTYLSWAWAWAEVKKVYPDAVYEIEKFNGIPYAYDPLTGYMVYTKVTIGDVTHEMWLPVMDGNNKAMKAEPYEIQTKYKTITVASATMFDINKTIMRCLVKNLAMFGLGLYIYTGEDLPETEEAEEAPAPKAKKTASKKTTTKPVFTDVSVNPHNDNEIAYTQTTPNAEAPKAEAKVEKFPNRNKFLIFCKKHDLDWKAICTELGLNTESPDSEFIAAHAHAVRVASQGLPFALDDMPEEI